MPPSYFANYSPDSGITINTFRNPNAYSTDFDDILDAFLTNSNQTLTAHVTDDQAEHIRRLDR